MDGQNFLYKAADFLIRANIISNKQELIKIDLRYIFGALFSGVDMEIKYFGVNTIKKQNNYDNAILEKSILFADNLRRLRNYLDKTSVNFYGIGSLQVRRKDACERCGYVGYKMAEKGVDVGLAVELVKDSFDASVERQIVASSDIDLLPAIKAARNNHKDIFYTAFKGKQIYAISSYAVETKIINPGLIIESYVRALKKMNN